MKELDECMSHYRRLMSLLEEDLEEVSRGFQNELLQAYQEIVQKEMGVLLYQTQKLYSIIKNN